MTAIPPNGADGTHRPAAVDGVGKVSSRPDGGVRQVSGPGVAPLADAKQAVNAPHEVPATGAGHRITELRGDDGLRAALPARVTMAILHAQLRAGLGRLLAPRLAHLMAQPAFTQQPQAAQRDEVLGAIVPMLLVNQRGTPHGF
jgi:hypothetical protein